MRALIAVLLFTTSMLAAPRRASTSLPLPVDRIDAAVRAQLANGVPGLSVAVQRGRVVYSNAFGVLERATQTPADGASVFAVGSVSKQFTAASILRLEEQGRLRVTDPIERWIPEFAGRGIRIEHLLRHTSGLVRQISYDLNGSHDDFIARLAHTATLFAPGTNWSYSNAAYYLLSVIAERASGQPRVQFLEQELFGPLALLQTGVCGTKSPIPMGHIRRVETGAMTELALPPKFAYGAGDICSSAIDLLRWNEALRDGRAVSRGSYERMRDGGNVGYGYGLAVSQWRGRTVVWHDGEVPGFQSVLIHLPDDDITVVVLANMIQDDRGVLVIDTGFAVARALIE